MNDKRLRTLIIIGFIVLSAAIIGIIALITKNSNSESEQPAQTESIDAASGDTVQNTDGKTPEKYGVNPNQPIYLGFSELLDRGMEMDEVDNAKAFLNDYVNKQLQDGKPKIEQISVVADSVEHAIKSAEHEEIFSMVLTISSGQQFTFTVTTDADTDLRTLSLIQSDAVVYSTEQAM